MRTLQEMFNLAYKGMESQNWVQSLSSEGACSYLNSSNLKCAIGHTITGIEQYINEMWFVTAVSLIPSKILDTNATNLSLMKLQNAHDMANSPEDCKARFEAFAKDYSLSIPDS
jgi:hypothetical protein